MNHSKIICNSNCLKYFDLKIGFYYLNNLIFIVCLLFLPPKVEAQRLAGLAILPSATFTEGPTCGRFIESANGVEVPFLNRQPVQGISSVLKAGGNSYYVLSDNGFGAKENSADYVLRVYKIRPDFSSVRNGLASITVEGFFSLHDPDHKVPFPIVAEMDHYPHETIRIPVDTRIQKKRLLTGADFDPESFQQLSDGTFWFGDEFGPFLIHTDSTGKILEAPAPLPGIQSPQNPYLGEKKPDAKPSAGFEGMALSLDGKQLYPMLEKALIGRPEKHLNIYEFDLLAGKYLNEQPVRRYKLEPQGKAAAEFVALTESKFLVIERDDGLGKTAKFKKIYLVDFNRIDNKGFLVKKELIDLLNIPDPDNIAGNNDYFTFPFETIESLAMIDASTIGVLNDNNFPFSIGRHVKQGLPDDSEFILIRFDQSFHQMQVE